MRPDRDLHETPGHLDPGHNLVEKIIFLPDGRRIRAVVGGLGPSPLVVFEAGMSAAASSWIHTQREISTSARTLSYDRAGYGGSEIDPQERTLKRIASDLEAVLDALGESDPVVLVGHSWGGPILRCFADQHPRRVAGLLFVDSTVAQSMSPRNARITAASFRIMAWLADIGGADMIKRVSLPQGSSAEISDEDMAIMMRDYACGRAMRAGGREARQITAALPELRRLQTRGTPDVPTIALQGGRVDPGMAKTRPRLNETAAALMGAAPNGKMIIVEGAGHLIPQECPAAVHQALLDLLEAVAED